MTNEYDSKYRDADTDAYLDPVTSNNAYKSTSADNNIQIKFYHIYANGIRHRISQCATNHKPEQPTQLPLVLFLHGWPDGWFTWRHQLIAIARSGYLAVAPDMRGYGGTDAPPDPQSYSVHTLVSDVYGIVHALGYSRCHLVGHDWGAWLVWNLALIVPEMVLSVCALSVPRALRRSTCLLGFLKGRYGDCIHGSDKEKRSSRFNYMLHHNLPDVDIEYDRNTREALYRIYFYHRGVEYEEGTPEFISKNMYTSEKEFVASNAPGLWCRSPRPIKIPSWSSKEEFNYAVNEFERTGFAGGLKWYQTLDLNWSLTQYLDGTQVQKPVLFMAGSNDMVIDTHGGCDATMSMLKESCSNLVACHFFQGCGHWIHQQKANEVNCTLIKFLKAHTPISKTVITKPRL